MSLLPSPIIICGFPASHEPAKTTYVLAKSEGCTVVQHATESLTVNLHLPK